VVDSRSGGVQPPILTFAKAKGNEAEVRFVFDLVPLGSYPTPETAAGRRRYRQGPAT